MNLEDLKKPFDPKRVSWRVGATNGDKTKGMMLAYIDARDVQDRLDEVCGIANWQCRYALQDKTTICEVGVKIGDEWVWKADGAGATDVEAEKGQLSDAFKRAAVKWGIGRYLYDVASPWVEIEGSGRSHKMKPGQEGKLIAALTGSAQPTNAPPKPSLPPHDPKTGEVLDKPADDRASKAIAWGKEAIEKVRAFRDPDAFKQWYDKPAVRANITALGLYDKGIQNILTEEVIKAEDRFNPLAA